MSPPPSRSLPTLLLEGAAIVISILLAFAIQAAWETRQEAELEDRALSTVLAELDYNLDVLTQSTRFHEAMRGASEAVLALAHEAPGSLDEQKVDSLLAVLTWWRGTADWSTGALDALVAGGNLSAVGLDPLRAALAALPQQLEDIRLNDEQDYRWFADVYVPLLRESANLSQISAAVGQRPGSIEGYEFEPTPYVGPRTDHRPLIVSQPLQNAVLEKNWVEQDILGTYGLIRNRLERLRLMIQQEIAAPS